MLHIWTYSDLRKKSSKEEERGTLGGYVGLVGYDGWMGGCGWEGAMAGGKGRWAALHCHASHPSSSPSPPSSPAQPAYPSSTSPPSRGQTKPRESADALHQQPHHLLIVVDGVGVLGGALAEWNQGSVRGWRWWRDQRRFRWRRRDQTLSSRIWRRSWQRAGLQTSRCIKNTLTANLGSTFQSAWTLL